MANKSLVCEELKYWMIWIAPRCWSLVASEHSIICCTKMKGGRQGVVRKLFLLTLIPQLSSFEVVNQTDVEKYVTERRGGSNADLFLLNYKDGSYCVEDPNGVSKWCTNLKASLNDTLTKGKSCGCSCSPTFPTFLPSNLTCISESQAQILGGKSEPLFDIFQKLNCQLEIR